MTVEDLGFWIVAIISVGSAVLVVAHRNPVRSALFLVANFLCLAYLYLTLNAQLLAALQILVYAGAIMVLFLFVIMLLNLGGEQNVDDPLPGQKAMAVVLGVVMLAGLWFAVRSGAQLLSESGASVATASAGQGDQVSAIGHLLMKEYVYPFELTSVLLLVGIIGTVLLAMHRRADEGGASARQ